MQRMGVPSEDSQSIQTEPVKNLALADMKAAEHAVGR